jgi:hypothetical protein
MNARAFFLTFVFGVSAVSFGACSSSIEIVRPSSGGSGGAGGEGGGGGGCAGAPQIGECIYGCGSDAFEPAICVGDTWVCPVGTVPVKDCPPSSCIGAPLACEICLDDWVCKPEAACIGACEAIVCGTCNGAPAGMQQIGACSCACDDTGNQYGCTKVPGCCIQDIDCGDEVFVPCVNNVCKTPVPGKCWSDVECGPNMKCEGEGVCPCNYDCFLPDEPGMCVPI